MTPSERAELEREIARFKWFHQIDFGDGVLAPGWIRAGKIRRMVRALFDRPLAGKSVLDVGCWDGAYSIAAARLGASRILATDHYAWTEGAGYRGAFELARSRLAPDIEVMDITVEDLTVERVGQFDVVLFAGVELAPGVATGSRTILLIDFTPMQPYVLMKPAA